MLWISTVPFRCCFLFLQHIPSKQATFVTKIWAVCDARSIYAQVYAAKPAGAQSERQNQDMRVILNLNYLWQLLSITCRCPADAKKKAVHGGNSKKTGVKNRQDLVLMKVCLLWCPQKREEFQVMSWNKADWNTGLGDDLQCRLYKQPNQTWSVLTLGGQTAWLLLLRKLLRFRNSNLTQLWHIRKQLPLIINYQNNQLQHYRKDHSMIFRISQTFL